MTTATSPTPPVELSNSLLETINDASILSSKGIKDKSSICEAYIDLHNAVSRCLDPMSRSGSITDPYIALIDLCLALIHFKATILPTAPAIADNLFKPVPLSQIISDHDETVNACIMMMTKWTGKISTCMMGTISITVIDNMNALGQLVLAFLRSRFKLTDDFIASTMRKRLVAR